MAMWGTWLSTASVGHIVTRVPIETSLAATLGPLSITSTGAPSLTG